MAYVDGGYTLIFKALPADAQRPDTRLRQRDLYNVMALALLNEAISNFQDLLRELPPRHKSRTTVRKQGTSDTARFHVLARDKEFILSLLDRAVAKANECHFLKVVCFLNQFGQKQTEGLMMGTVVQLTRIKSISLHFACNISAQDPRTSLLFSRYGLQDLVGVRGSLCTTLGIHKATNFHSNLDNLPMDVSEELLNAVVLLPGAQLNFVQLYVDSPQAHLQMPYKHPVSGAIVTCGLSHPNFHVAVNQRAGTYLCHMTDL